MQKAQVQYTPDPDKFDLRTHIWDGNGKLITKNPYRTFYVGDQRFFERPVNSGNLWYENNQPAGRVELNLSEDGKIISKEIKLGEPHKDFKPPLTGAEKLHYQLEQEIARREELERELAAYRKAGGGGAGGGDASSAILASVQEGFPNPELKKAKRRD